MSRLRNNYCKLVDGRTGIVNSYNLDNTVTVQLGPDGPIETINNGEFTLISEDEFWRSR